MNAKMLGLFSGFPSRRFPADIAQCLAAELPVRDSLVFISAWPGEAVRNDEDAAGMHGMFVEWGLSFGRYAVIDDRTEPAHAASLVREASCIFLMGGNATQQHRLILEKGIRDELRASAAVILGVSAGSSNMAVRALDVWESHVPYEGLGLADVTIKAHVQPDNQELLDILLQISLEHQLPICAMADDSAIFIRGGKVTCMGSIRLVNAGKVSPLTEEMLERMLIK